MMLKGPVFTVIGDFSAPPTPGVAEKYVPPNMESFSDGLLYVIKQGIQEIAPNLSNALSVCCVLIAIAVLFLLMQNFTEKTHSISRIVGVVAVSALLLNSTSSLISLGAETVMQISDYGKLLVPILSTALAAQGGGGSAVLLYSGTIVFNTILTSILSNILIPCTYIYIAVSIANRTVGNEMLSNIGRFFKSGTTWILKTTLYIFTGYMTVTGVVSGSVDAASIKAAKIAISGSVPVVGGILSDASEAFLAGVNIAKNTAGITGLITVLAILIGPFLELGVQYVLLKGTGAICSIFDSKGVAELIDDYSVAMGFLLAATGAIGFIHIFSTVCFLRGIA